MMFKRGSKYRTQSGEVMRKCLYWQSTKIRETVQKVRAKNIEPKGTGFMRNTACTKTRLYTFTKE